MAVRQLIKQQVERCQSCSTIGFHDCPVCGNEGKVMVEVFVTPLSEWNEFAKQYNENQAKEEKKHERNTVKLHRSGCKGCDRKAAKSKHS